MTLSRLTSTAPLNVHRRNSAMSSMGVSRRFWRRTNSTPKTEADATIASSAEALDAVDRELLDARRRSAPSSASDSTMLSGSKRPGARVAALGHEDRHEDEQRHEHRHGHEEHRAPREVLEQDAADDGTEGGTRREPRRPHRDRQAALVAVGEDAAQQRERRRHEHRAEDAQRRARGDQPLGGRARTRRRPRRRRSRSAPMSSIRRRPNRSPSSPIVTRRLASTSG